ncbi:MAG: hypothetical protein R2909_09985 [Gemmatimonadales bacterium]
MDKRTIETADRYSRRRITIALLAVVAFLGVQLIATPAVFRDSSPTRIDWWAINAVALLAVLATGGGVLNSRPVRSIVQDELARANLRAAIRTGYWVAMGLALVLYLGPWFRDLTMRQGVYLIVTGSVVVPLLAFALLELRAHADG